MLSVFKPLQGKWSKISQRERWIIVFAMYLSVVMVLYYKVHIPLENFKSKSIKNVAQLQDNLQWFNQHSQDFVALSKKKKLRTKQNKSILTIIDVSAKSSGIHSSIQSISPDTKNKFVRVSYKELSFNKWLSWVHKLKVEEGVKVQSAVLRRTEKGKVIASAVFIRE